MGDPSDNIKSVLKSCGPKTAFKERKRVWII
jgi:5'-3' exonuclease